MYNAIGGIDGHDVTLRPIMNGAHSVMGGLMVRVSVTCSMFGGPTIMLCETCDCMHKHDCA